MRALRVDRLQRRRDLAAAETGEDRETWQLKLGKTGRHNESSASGQAPEEEGPDGLSSGSPLPMGFHSSSTPRSWFSYRVWERPHISKQTYTN